MLRLEESDILRWTWLFYELSFACGGVANNRRQPVYLLTVGKKTEETKFKF